ncbi:MAG: right-handed parallel beta-helix repeat-containing protein [Treponema sp.]|nr:right-handed parallel beta-helix repeat-containing protein [Treponema sp.]
MNSKAKKVVGIVACLYALTVISCNNLIHDLVPPSGDIISFRVCDISGNDVTVQSAITGTRITVDVLDSADITTLIPVVEHSPKATVLPLTIAYIQRAFPTVNLLKAAVGMYEAKENDTLLDWTVDFLRQHQGFKVPPLDEAIDFSSDVPFGILAGNGEYRAYSVSVNFSYSDNSDSDSSAEKNIISFTVHNQIDESVIGEKTVDFTVPSETYSTVFVPTVSVSEGATILPLTQNVLMELVDGDMVKLVSFYSGFAAAADAEKYVEKWVRANNIEFFDPLACTYSIDFSEPVYYLIKGSDGSIKFYKVTCHFKDVSPKLKNVTFSKYNNEGLVRDASGSVSTSGTVYVSVYYPAEYTADGGSLSLVPDVTFIGDKITYSISGSAEMELVSGVTAIPFTDALRECQVCVYLDGEKKEYTLTATYYEDRDTIRSITDFRFKKELNSDIQATAMASIFDEGDTGLITVTVLYTGECPYDLIPTFVTPGTVTIEHVQQISGVTKQNYSTSLQYLCTSRNGLYCRLYTVRVAFIQVAPAVAAITSFSFPSRLNEGLSCDAEGVVSDATDTILVEVRYSQYGFFKLIPEFSATGPVTVSGITQSSGFSAQNFRAAVYYTVTAAEDSSVTKTYKVQVTYKQDEDSACSLDSFTFIDSLNPTLRYSSPVTVLLSEHTLTGFALLPQGTDSAHTPLVPTFTAHGTVSVNGVQQQSGVSAVDFSSPVVYTVTSANGFYTKEYTITLQETGTIIYVDSNAIGRSNGTSWQDAYISLYAALESMSQFKADTMTEVWVADRGMYHEPMEVAYFTLYGSVALRGGFNGTETSINEREQGRRTKLTASKNSTNGVLYGTTAEATIVLDGLEINDVYNVCSKPVSLLKSASTEIVNCAFRGNYHRINSITESGHTAVSYASYSLRNICGATVVIKDSVFDCDIMIAANDGGFENCAFKSQTCIALEGNSSRGAPISFSNCTFGSDMIFMLGDYIDVELPSLPNGMFVVCDSYTKRVIVRDSNVTFECYFPKNLVVQDSEVRLYRIWRTGNGSSVYLDNCTVILQSIVDINKQSNFHLYECNVESDEKGCYFTVYDAYVLIEKCKFNKTKFELSKYSDNMNAGNITISKSEFFFDDGNIAMYTGYHYTYHNLTITDSLFNNAKIDICYGLNTVAITNCTFLDSAEHTLRARDSITFRGNRFYAPTTTVQFTADANTNFVYDDNLVIDNDSNTVSGLALTFKGSGSYSFYGQKIKSASCENAAATFDNCIFDASSNYSCIRGFSSSRLYIKNCNFRNLYRRSAIIYASGELFMDGCQFANITHNNLSSNDIISIDGNAYITDCTFKDIYLAFYEMYNDNNKYSCAHLIDSSSSEFVIDRCTFVNIVTEGGGAAIYATGNTLIRDCYFADCVAVKHTGGAIYFSALREFNVNFTVQNCTFLRNTAKGGGGAIAIFMHNPCTLHIDSCRFAANASTIFAGNATGSSICDENSFIMTDTYVYGYASDFLTVYKGVHTTINGTTTVSADEAMTWWRD